MSAGEWGNLLGLDCIPEVRTLRQKLKLLCAEAGRATRWNADLAREWIREAQQRQPQGVAFYVDGHVRVYHGELPRFTLIFDREGYSPDLFAELQKERIAALSYHRYPGQDWPLEEFQ